MTKHSHSERSRFRALPPRVLLTGLILASVGSVIPAASAVGLAHPCRVVILNTLQAPLSKTFSGDPGYGWWSFNDDEAIGPRFVLNRAAELKEVGGFINMLATHRTGGNLRFQVTVYRASPDGSPKIDEVVASSPVSNDGEPAVWRYEKARFNKRLRAGTYFALFGLRSNNRGVYDPGGVLNDVSKGVGEPVYTPGLAPVASLDPTSGSTAMFDANAAFRVVVARS
jgi:hypothetical protein